MSENCDTFLKCDRCLPAKCCSAVAMEIDKPTALEDYENLLWYVAHDNIHLFIEGKSWFMNIISRCDFLGLDNRCMGYERRPQICRDYSLDDCEFDTPIEDLGYEAYFENFDQLEAYVWKKFGKRFVKDAPMPQALKIKLPKRIFPTKKV